MSVDPAQTHHLVREFFAGLSAGNLPDELLTDDMTAWTTTSGTNQPRERYQGGIKLMQAAFDGGNAYTVEAITAEDDRAAAEVTAAGKLVDGQDFANRYVFTFRIRDGRIAHVAEHFNPDPVREKLAPLLQQIIAKMQQG